MNDVRDSLHDHSRPPFPDSRPCEGLRSRSLGAFDLTVVRTAFRFRSNSVRNRGVIAPEPECAAFRYGATCLRAAAAAFTSFGQAARSL